jgi:cob(I)alamin adenosyltransferase
MQHVVVTGRGAPQELIDLADTVTEMGVVKHAFKDQGIKAQKGVEL